MSSCHYSTEQKYAIKNIYISLCSIDVRIHFKLELKRKTTIMSNHIIDTKIAKKKKRLFVWEGELSAKFGLLIFIRRFFFHCSIGEKTNNWRSEVVGRNCLQFHTIKVISCHYRHIVTTIVRDNSSKRLNFSSDHFELRNLFSFFPFLFRFSSQTLTEWYKNSHRSWFLLSTHFMETR